jgi:hypothetical protein
MKTQDTSKFFLFLTICFFLFIAATHNDRQTFEKITVKEFELVGENGERRVNIKVEPNGEVMFRMMDQSGSIRVKLGAGKDGSGFVLLNQETEPAIHALAKKEGGKLTLQDSKGKKREF